MVTPSSRTPSGRSSWPSITLAVSSFIVSLYYPRRLLDTIRFATGPPRIRSEDGRLVGYVFVDPGQRPLGAYVEEARRAVAERVTLPSGVRIGKRPCRSTRSCSICWNGRALIAAVWKLWWPRESTSAPPRT